MTRNESATLTRMRTGVTSPANMLLCDVRSTLILARARTDMKIDSAHRGPLRHGVARRSRPGTGLVLALGCSLLVAGCTPDDEPRPGFPRTGRTPLVGAPFPYAVPEDVGLSSDDIWWLKERVYSRIVARHVIGAEILVIKDRRIVLHQAMGWADRDELEPLERNSVFRLASMTKPLVGTAVLMLADEGRLGLDDLVAEYLPSFDNELSRTITVRQLLIHRSGFVQGGQPPGYSDRSSLREAVDVLGRTGPTFEPGERFVYSNLNSEVLGALVTEVTGMPVESFLENRILSPLGMADTHPEFQPSAPWADRAVSSYRRWGAGPWERYWHPGREDVNPWFSPAGDMLGTAFDYARFLSAWADPGQLEAGRLVSAASARAALSDPEFASGASPRARYFGMHWEIYSASPAAGELPTFGHRGATGTLGMAIPEHGVIVVFLTNSQETEVVDEVIELTLRLFGGGRVRQSAGALAVHHG